MLQSIMMSPQVILLSFHSPNKEKMPLRLSFLLSFSRSNFLCVSVLPLKLLPSSIQSSLHLDKNVRGCALLLLYFLSDLYQLKLCLTAQHSPSYLPSFPCVLVHISTDYFPSRFKYPICDSLLNTIVDLHLLQCFSLLYVASCSYFRLHSRCIFLFEDCLY